MFVSNDSDHIVSSTSKRFIINVFRPVEQRSHVSFIRSPSHQLGTKLMFSLYSPEVLEAGEKNFLP